MPSTLVSMVTLTTYFFFSPPFHCFRMRWATWGLTSQGKTGDFKAIIWTFFFFFFKENRQLCNLKQTLSGIFALKDAVRRNWSQNPFCPLLPYFYYYHALIANTASKLPISVTMAIKWVRFPSIMTWIVRTLQRAHAFAQGRGMTHSGENSYFNSLQRVEDHHLPAHMHMENHPHAWKRMQASYLGLQYLQSLQNSRVHRLYSQEPRRKREKARGKIGGSNPGASKLSLWRTQC